MSLSRTVQSAVAVIGDGVPRSSKPEGRTAAKPKRRFDQTPALANAVQTAKTDKTGAPEKQGVEALVQAAGWQAYACLTPAGLARGRPESGTTLSAAGSTGPVQLTRHVGGGRGKTAEPVPAEIAKGGRNSPASEKNLAPAKEHAKMMHGANANAKSDVQSAPEIAKGGRNSLASEKSLAAAKEHARMMHGANANAKSDVQSAAESSKSDVAAVRRHLQRDAARAKAASDKPSTQAPHSVRQALRQVHPQGRPSDAAPAENAAARRAIHETVVSNGGKQTGPSQHGDNLTTPSVPAISGAGKSAMISQLVPERASVAAGMEGHATKTPAQSVGEQIRDSVHASLSRGEQQLTIRLRPPELGSVLVRFGEQNGQIDGVLEVTRTDTRQEVEQALPQVLRTLQDLGIAVRRFEVTVADPSQEDSGGEQLQQDASPQQQGFDGYANQAQRSPDSGSSLEGTGSQDGMGDPGNITAASGVPAGRIDMLA